MKLKIIILCLFFALACDDQKASTEDTIINNRSDKDPTSVAVYTATIKPLDYIINTAGKVISFKSIELKSPSTGMVENVLIENGERVEKGQTIIVLVDDKEKIAFERAKIDLTEYQLKYENELISYEGGDKGKVVSEEILENLRISTGLKKAELNYSEAELNYKSKEIKSPFSGVVADFSVVPGQYINTGEKLSVLNDNRALGVEINLLEIDYSLLKKGYKATIVPIGSTDVEFQGTVKNINPVVDKKTGLVKVSLSIPATSFRIIPGMNVDVYLKVPGKPQIVVPKDAVIIRSGREVVFTMEDGLAKWNYVKAGKENGKEIEILEGLSKDQTVIVSNNLQLSHDAPVTVESNR